jgi:hypothetical protein
MAYSLGSALGAIASSRSELPPSLQHLAQEAVNTVLKPPFEGNPMARVAEIADKFKLSGLSFKVEDVSANHTITASNVTAGTIKSDAPHRG